jgi:hypothetical protein
MLLNYIKAVEVIQVKGHSLWFNTHDLGAILKVPPCLIAPKFKHKITLLKGSKNIDYIDEANLLAIFNYDPELYGPFNQYRNTGSLTTQAIMSTAEKILRIGLAYRAISLGNNYCTAVVAEFNGAFVLTEIKDSWGLKLPAEASDAFLKEVAQYFVKSQLFTHGTKLKKLQGIVTKCYGVTLLNTDTLIQMYINGWPELLMETLIIEWQNHTDWNQSLLDILPAIKFFDLASFKNAVSLPRVRPDLLRG